MTFHQAESFKSECYGGSGLYYRGDSVGVNVCVKDCDPESKWQFTFGWYDFVLLTTLYTHC